ncbi:transposase [Salmonella enterica]|nr:transposase [Salmonella enterica subsp. enterica]EJW2018224.1 transposase [Salmonella enterica]EHW9182646.1 transposase [Salmonella enterica subsp. enterica]EJW2022729.1 transposase [Salmonella enterica]EJW2098438.1 transposase [Salmonella enterica]
MKSSPSLRLPRHSNYPLEFKLDLVERSYQPGISVAQLARDNGVNDNLLFKWRQFWREGKLRRTDEAEPPRAALVPVTVDAPDICPARQPDEEEQSLSCEAAFRHGTLRLTGNVSNALLSLLIQELKK